MRKSLILLLVFLCLKVYAQIPMQWQSQLPTSYDYNDLQMLDNNTIVAVGLTGSFIRSNDGGLTWKFTWTNTLLNLTGVDFTDSNIGYACGEGNQYSSLPGIVVKTIDGGITWDSLGIPYNAMFSDIDFINPDTGWVAADSGKVYRTNNGGLTWTDQSFVETKMIRRIFMANADTGYVAGENGLLYRTFNGGTYWSPCPPLTTNRINSVFFLNGQTGWCGADNEYIYRTDNSGDTWNIQLNGGSATPVMTVYFVDSLKGHAISTAFTYHTSDGGQHWYTFQIHCTDLLQENLATFRKQLMVELTGLMLQLLLIFIITTQFSLLIILPVIALADMERSERQLMVVLHGPIWLHQL